MPGHRRLMFMLLLRTGVPSSWLERLSSPLLLAKGSPSMQVRVGCKCCLPEGCVPMLMLCYFSAGVRALI